jgi:hypothetical protein
MAKRIYLVSDFVEEDAEAVVNPHLVSAMSLSQAIGHVSKPRFKGRVASQSDLVKYLAKHVVEEVGEVIA